MNVLMITQSEMPALLPMRECIDVVARVLETVARGEAVLPLRQQVVLPDGSGRLVQMPAFAASPPALGVKVITVFPGNEGTDVDSHQGAVLLFDPADGRLLAVMDASSITAIRTAAASAVATRLLAREDAAELAILGSGVQARTHVEAMLCVRPIRRVRVWSRTPAHARAFAREAEARHGIPVEPVSGARDAVAGADVVCTVTSAREPILRGEWVPPGAHVNAVGSSTRDHRELDAEAVRRSRLYVDRRESALAEAGDFLLARAEGAVDDGHIVGEIGDIIAGGLEGRRSAGEITLFKSVGIAVEDLAAAHHVYESAIAGGGVTVLDLGGSRGREAGPSATAPRLPPVGSG